MLDLTGIMFSSIMMLFVLVRALKLDSTLPWFPALKQQKEAPAPADPRAWRRRI